MENKEEIYDKEIAPLLMKAGRIAQKHDMPFTAWVQYTDDGAMGETSCHIDISHNNMKLGYWMLRAKGNLDAFVIKVLRSFPEGNSMVLSLLKGAMK